jgi:hypothetical protein
MILKLPLGVWRDGKRRYFRLENISENEKNFYIF